VTRQLYCVHDAMVTQVGRTLDTTASLIPALVSMIGSSWSANIAGFSIQAAVAASESESGPGGPVEDAG
jgi:hypothetical protein